MTVKEVIDDVQHHIYVSKESDSTWWARIDAISNPTPGATRFPIQYEESGKTRGEAIKNLYRSLQGQGGLVNLKSEQRTPSHATK
jgi:hypothetical protein